MELGMQVAAEISGACDGANSQRTACRSKALHMDGLREFLGDLKRGGYAQGNLLGLLNVMIGRQIRVANGAIVSSGVTWRVLAEWLKRVRWDKEEARQLGLDPALLPPRDRQRYWYLVITQARVDSPEAIQAGNRLAAVLRQAGYIVLPEAA
jgi:hypothetical protein